MGRPVALDLFCGAGGVSMGLHRAGFDVVGVDIKPQPRYPFNFIQGNALRPPVDLDAFDFIWASPPCQAHTALKTAWNAKEHADLIPETRTLLMQSGKPWCMENVPGAPMKNAFVLCGTMFGLQTQKGDGILLRHRLFEASFFVITPECNHAGPVIGVYGGHARARRRAVTVTSKGGGYNKNKGRPSFGLSAAKEAMGIDWMDSYTLSQAIPPAYSEFIGRYALAKEKPNGR